ncbi:hypothetical protein MPTK1_2g17150 [Marchantia polymorpha subsp. ruderalis]|uniref:Uncharacterized protein n=1 Tax=Marchantia polymorpha TaxID=3197 RepID=A0A2R6WCQ8_MARPO|nr:hypothetical protein MARPO_0109s0056 [Marchantia polymorpha]BBN02678.1 hypothetical protein Mp_2g17150 [Marchantia polymorpha subsp. ruderalis]|eukprot:PTQ31636.1 hypothetical protein MARPO_0109s0056 [Marchantia polymorpha]
MHVSFVYWRTRASCGRLSDGPTATTIVPSEQFVVLCMQRFFSLVRRIGDDLSVLKKGLESIRSEYFLNSLELHLDPKARTPMCAQFRLHIWGTAPGGFVVMEVPESQTRRETNKLHIRGLWNFDLSLPQTIQGRERVQGGGL